MDSIAINIVNSGAAAYKRFNELSEMLAAPEYSADRAVYAELMRESRAIERRASAYAEWKELGELIAADPHAAESEALERERERLLFRIALPSEKTAEKRSVSVKLRGGSPALAEYYSEAVKGAALLADGSFEVADCVREKGRLRYIKLTISGANGLFDLESGIHSDGVSEIEVLSCPLAETAGAFDEKDVAVSLFRSDGAGGQNVNKVETAVRATDLPTGISVVCRDERSQLQNKRKALARLKERVEKYYAETAAELTAAAERSCRNNARVRTYFFEKGVCKDVRLPGELPCRPGNAEDFVKLLSALKTAF